MTMAWAVGSDYWGAVAVEVLASSGGAGGGSTTYDATGPSASGAKTTNATSLSWSHTVSGSNTALVVGVAVGKNGDAGMSASATYNGAAMTLLKTVHDDNQSDGFLDVFGLAGVPVGTHTVTVTVSGGTANEITGGSESFDGAAQSGTFGTPASGQSQRHLPKQWVWNLGENATRRSSSAPR